jgi:hypothetical protein
LSPNGHFPELTSPHPKVVERSPLQSLKVFENPLFSSQSSSPKLPMDGARGAKGGGAGGQGQGQVPPPRIFSKVASRYAPLVLPDVLHDFSKHYMKNLPKFMGEGYLTTTEHIAFFDQFTYILGIEHEDVYSRLLVQNFEGQVRTWFQGLLVASIRSYDDLENAFLRQWGEKKDHLYYLTKFGALRKKNYELVLEFTQRFNKLYNKIPVKVKPYQPDTKVTFVGAFEPNFALLLRERRSATLVGMQDDAIEIESNMMASGKLKTKVDTGTKEPKRFKEQAGPFGSGKSTKEKMDEMAKIIKDLSNKISKMELDQAKPDTYLRN